MSLYSNVGAVTTKICGLCCAATLEMSLQTEAVMWQRGVLALPRIIRHMVTGMQVQNPALAGSSLEHKFYKDVVHYSIELSLTHCDSHPGDTS